MYQETEVKFYILDLPTVEARILDLGGTPIHPRVLETNLRFDTPEDSLAQDYRVLRLRQDSRVRLTYKGPGKFEEGVRVREEIEFEVDDFDAAWALLKALGYHVSLVYEKYRTVYHLDDHEIVLDETPLGNFIEIEGRSGSTIAVTAKKIGLDWTRRVNESYAYLFEIACLALGLPATEMTFSALSKIKITPESMGLTAGDLVD